MTEKSKMMGSADIGRAIGEKQKKLMQEYDRIWLMELSLSFAVENIETSLINKKGIPEVLAWQPRTRRWGE